ncbi:SURF1 family protein [Oricola thermophila]|uniref:SURF1-like protein n=1 Tax=Oricola thermophila TaxID=2742145 RepID=A0A6N1VEB2_9HYPH|nr:SURF1 family protein [Oricola thermophila]QKV18873.1 SURF1 family protein [Oricola thermophila]
MNERTATHRERTGIPWLLILLSLVALAILVSLGNWQVRRLAWKQDLLATIDARIHADPVPLAEALERMRAGEDIEYLPVSVRGTFLPNGEQHVLSTWKGVSGWNIYQPLRLEGGAILFVNRGFVPYDRKEPETRPESLAAGEQELTGLARLPLDEKPSFLVPENDIAKNQYHWKDIVAMTAAAGLAAETVVPLFVDAGPYDDPAHLPIGGVTNIDLPNNHLQYAATWYGLALALAGVVGVFLWRRYRG